MKVILLENVAKVGKKYDLVDVAPGYARNFLIPGNLGEPVTPASAGRIAALRREKEVMEKKHAEALATALAGKKSVSIEFQAKANEEGHLFAGIDREMIAREATKLFGVEIDAEMVELDKSIKALGKKEVTINAKGSVATVTVDVVAE